ncbi:DUF664 domain-containing protein [Propioniciclava coleopterorum]|uniref:DUF664 domain-containing protein n=1 Tax=Propioniciclava coleopterorum TaxID=2714937 RepID=A0A6G7Y562_9ACTN|nr:DUF664 domain-containing protein [Propioniciclava coleopterorum]QIK71778.1 DUF664 domain-containing protein [Propioniciclava coleopterorum]
MNDPTWEPPLAGDEAAHLFGALDRMRATFRWKADGLDADGLAFRLPSSELSLGGLLKHLAACEVYRFGWDVDGSRPDSPFDEEGHGHQWALDSAAEDPPQEQYALYDGAVARARERARAALASGGLDQRVALSDQWGETVSLRRLVFDLLEEYGRHTGHADLLREAVDGRVGEDPPPDWAIPAAWADAPRTVS